MQQANHTPPEQAIAMPMRWPAGTVAILREPGIEASGAYGRAIKRSMVARTLDTVLLKGAIFHQAGPSRLAAQTPAGPSVVHDTT